MQFKRDRGHVSMVKKIAGIHRGMNIIQVDAKFIISHIDFHGLAFDSKQEAIDHIENDLESRLF